MYFRLDFFMEAVYINSDQTDLGPYCLLYSGIILGPDTEIFAYISAENLLE